jgi:hypothetical protein
MVPVSQFGAALPPWQLTFEQVTEAALYDAAPDFAL